MNPSDMGSPHKRDPVFARMLLAYNELEQPGYTKAARQVAMSKHVLTCECGQTLAVDTAQAGETVTCGCGKTIAVPTLRQLREMPLAEEVPGSAGAATAGTWGVRQGVMAVCLIAAALCLAVAGYSRYSQPELPQFDANLYTERIDRVVETMTPIDAWRSYVNSYRPLAMVGLQEFRHPVMDSPELEVRWHQLVQAVMVGAAAIALVTAGVIRVATPRN